MELKKYKVCPSCGTHNRPSSLECRACETDLTGVRVVDSEARSQETDPALGRLVRICEECQTHNPAQARKCSRCGEDISHILPVPDQESSEKPISYQLNAIDGNYQAVISDPVSIVGRQGDLQDYLADKMYVSRRHAELTIVQGKVWIRNLSSTNKTFINNVEISGSDPVQLNPGDEIGLGGKVVQDSRQDQAAYFIYQDQL